MKRIIRDSTENPRPTKSFGEYHISPDAVIEF